MRTGAKVIGSDASGVVANVHHDAAIQRLVMGQIVGGLVCANAMIEDAVATVATVARVFARGLRALPKPATFGLEYLRPEARRVAA